MSKKKPEQPKQGYPHIEKLIETEDFDAVNQSISSEYKSLSAILDDKTAGLKKHKEARKAMKAYELTTDLLKELLKLKFAMLGDEKKSKKK